MPDTALSFISLYSILCISSRDLLWPAARSIYIYSPPYNRGWPGSAKFDPPAAPNSNLRVSLRKSPANKSLARALLARRRGGPIPGPMNPNESSFRCRCIRHGRVALIPGHGSNLNFGMTLCGTLHIRFEQPLTVVLPIRCRWASEQKRTTILVALWQV